GNFTKIPQRLSVRIAVDPDQAAAQHLRPGMSVVVSVDTRGGTATPVASAPAGSGS
ncbi:MAG: hemolysin secretion protein, partial [Variovorax sp.]|nr:hemolysin secretion protein [Variovorax sp.]